MDVPPKKKINKDESPQASYGQRTASNPQGGEMEISVANSTAAITKFDFTTNFNYYWLDDWRSRGKEGQEDNLLEADLPQPRGAFLSDRRVHT